MKGKYAVAVAPVASDDRDDDASRRRRPPPPPPTGTVGTGNTTVQVGMFEYGYNLSQQSVPSGQVTFVIRNNGSEVHNFSVQGVKVGHDPQPRRHGDVHGLAAAGALIATSVTSRSISTVG